VGYMLRMSGEIHDWLADLRGSDPSAAMVVGQVLTALLAEGASLGPPVVMALADSPRPTDLPDALDRSYQDRLEQLQIMRRRVAAAATLARDIQLEIAELESLQATPGEQRSPALDEGRPEMPEKAAGELAAAHDQAGELRLLLPGVVEAEQRLSQKGQRLQVRVDAFRTRKEVLKATFAAAQAERAIHEAAAASPRDAGDSGLRDEGRDAPVTEAADMLWDITSEIERELGLLPSVEGLIELRPGAPGDSDIRILFAVEPPGTALLIAVLDGRGAVRDHYQEATLLSAEVLRRAQAGEAAEAATHAFDDKQSFLDEFFPGSADEVEAGATALVAGIRARTLTEQRTRLGLTQAQVAQRMNVRQERVSAIERADPGATEVRTLATYVEALGGRLQIIADFGGERVVLR